MGELPASPTCCVESEVPQLVLHSGDVDKSTTERRIKIINGFKPDSFIVDLESFVAGDGAGDCTSMNGDDGIHTGAVVDTHLTIKRSISKKGRYGYAHHFLGYPSASSPTVEGKDSSGGRTVTSASDLKKKPPPQVNKSNSTPKTMISMDHLHHLNNSIMHLDGHQTKLDSHNHNNQTSGTWGRGHNSLRPSSLSTTPRAGSSSSLFFSPRRVLFFFATLSSMGTMLLIYLTLSIVKV